MTVRSTADPRYRGRFAPTPSGPLHLGSLMTALASWLEARTRDGAWLLRIDDLDGPRCVPGAEAGIREQLERHGLWWDETPRYQSAHLAEYQAAWHTLHDAQRLYACRCTRATLAANSGSGPDGPVYPGTCRTARLPLAGHAQRLAVHDARITLLDGVHGALCRDLRDEVGDFVVRRRDGIFGYHLACAVDERAQQISDVVRGADLIGSTFAQLHLFDSFGWSSPRYHHVPVLLAADGLKLSKQNHATAADARYAGANLWHCLQGLHQDPPAALQTADASAVLEWARAHWRIERVGTAAVRTVEQPPQFWHDG